MDNKLTFSFIPTKEDYVRTFRTVSLRQTVTRLVIVITGLFFLSGLVTLILLWPRFNPIMVIPLVFFPIYVLSVIFPFRLVKQVESNERFTTEIKWEIDDTGTILRTKFTESKLDWGTFSEYFESSSYFYLVYSTNKNMSQFIPKKAFNSQDQEKQFRLILDEHIQRGKNVSREISWVPPKSLILGSVYGLLFICIVFLVVLQLK